jgi:hypothetical protein
MLEMEVVVSASSTWVKAPEGMEWSTWKYSYVVVMWSTWETLLINVIIDSNQKIVPKLQFGKPIEDLSPLLSRSEFKKNMIINSLQENSSNFTEAN